MPRKIPVAVWTSPKNVAIIAGAINKSPENCKMNPRLPHIGLYLSLITTRYVLNCLSSTEVLMAFAKPSWVTMPKIWTLSVTGIRFIRFNRINSKAILTLAFADIVMRGDVIIAFIGTWSESSPFITILSKISLSVIMPTNWSILFFTIMVSAFFPCINLTAVAASISSSKTINWWWAYESTERFRGSVTMTCSEFSLVVKTNDIKLC